jgi:CPA2 family monovalent cation:H+ antiporter-2
VTAADQEGRLGDAHAFLGALVVVLGVAAVTTVLFERLRQPVVLGYILAGLIVGPHLPVPVVADRAVVMTLSELGVVLLMFALGLEFRLRRLVQVGPTAGVTAIIESSIMVWLGFVAGRAFGWTILESVFAGAVVAISSTTIIAKAFDDRRVRGPLRDLVVGVLLVEDLFAVAFMAVLTAVATGAGVSPGELGTTLARLGAFLALLLAAGMLVVPRVIRYVRRLGRPETLLVVSLGLCFGIAYLALEAGYSVALGAFIAGSLVAESGEAHAVQDLVRPVRDLFAAIFFVSVGMLIDPALVARHWVAVAVFVALVVLGKSVAVGLGAFVTGHGVRTSVQAGMTLTQIGEFSFILASLGVALGATREFLYPIVVAVSAVTTLTTPWLIAASGGAAAWIDRKLPAQLQTVVALYGTWLEHLTSPQAGRGAAVRVRRILRVLLIDAVAVTAIVIGASVGGVRVPAWIATRLALSDEAARLLFLAVAALLAAPFVVGLVTNARKVGLALASAALPEAAAGRTDLAAAPRRALLAVVQLAATVVVLLPIIAVTQPFLPGVPGAVVLLAVIVGLGVGFWRSAANLQGHVRAGAQVLVEVLAKQGAPPEALPHAAPAPAPAPDPLAAFRALFPGLGDPVAVRLRDGSPAAGHSLSDLGVRGRTGAAILAIFRGDRSVMLPLAGEVLEARDLLVLAGSHEAVEAARELLAADPAAAPAGPLPAGPHAA